MGIIAIKATLGVMWEEPGRLTVGEYLHDEYLHNDVYAGRRQGNLGIGLRRFFARRPASFGKDVFS